MNKVVNELNVERMFLDPFMNRITWYLKSSQDDGNIDWAEQNFPLYTAC